MPDLRDIFSQSGGNLTIANSAVDVATAKQAVTDGNAAVKEGFDALRARAGPRTTGGGQFGALTPTRGTVNFGPLGGLATANRNVEAGVEKASNLVTRNVTRGEGIQANNPGWTADNAAASQTPAGYARNSGINVDGFRTSVTKYDESGTGTTTYR